MHPDPGDELVDQLDATGKVVGIVPRRRIRAQHLPHRCVYLLVFNARGELFVHQRTASKDIHPSFWDLTVGGLPAAGEPDDSAAVREAREELGVLLEPAPLFPFRYPQHDPVVFGTVFRAVHDGPFRLQPEEIARGEFVTPGQVAERTRQEPFCPDGLAVWQEFGQRFLLGKNS